MGGIGAITSNVAVATGSPTWTWAVPLIVGIIAFVGVVATAVVTDRNARRQLKSAHTLKISEMRQAWINDLRDAMATFQSYGVTPELDHRTCREFYEKGTKIELMMNPKDPDYPQLHDCLYDFFKSKTTDAKFSANRVFVEVCQRILKREWEVLKADVDAVPTPAGSVRSGSPSRISN